MNNRKKLALIQDILSMVPFIFILAMFLLHLALPEKTFSKEEQRYLSQWPAFHIEKILEGSYGKEIESYFSDQFPFRNFWIHIQRLADLKRAGL